MIASLIHANRPDPADLASDIDSDEEKEAADEPTQKSPPKKKKLRQPNTRSSIIRSCAFPRARATLVVAPMSLISQWNEEMQKASEPDTLHSMLYYADAKGALVDALHAGTVDVVITSYGTLVAEYRKFRALIEDEAAPTKFAYTCPLYAVQWHRLILDEAHNIKNRATQNSKACNDLIGKRRWCLTGTPIVNRLTDLYSLLRFLKVEPWGNFSFFNSFISKPFQAKNPKALDVVAVVLESVLLRREKRMKDKNGRPIVTLPEKTTIMKHLEFSDKERKLYQNIYHRARNQFEEMRRNGSVGKNYSLIFSVLMRLRQAVCHPILVLGHSEASGDAEQEDSQETVRKLVADFQAGDNSGDDSYAAKVLQDLMRDKGGGDGEDEDDNACPLCFEEMATRCLLPKCMHVGCKDCLTSFLQACEDKGQEPSCPTCRRGPVSIEDIIEVIRTRPRRNKIAEAVEAAEREGAAEDDEEAPPATQESTHSQPAFFLRQNNFKSSTKLEALIEDLNELRTQEGDLKAVVFSQFTSFLDLVEVVLGRNHFKFVRLDGTTSQKERERVLREFRANAKISIMLISLRAGGVGLNLTTASRVFMLDMWWNKAIEDQAVDRIHRIGQTRPVTVHRYLINDSIEERILAIQKRKAALVNNALSGAGKSDTLENLELLFGE